MFLILFTMAFVVGPALCLVLVHFDGRRLQPALIASVLVTLSFTFRNEVGLTPSVETIPLFLNILLIWLAWIVVLVMVAPAIREAYPSFNARRWSRTNCAMGTTVPWFGIRADQLMVK